MMPEHKRPLRAVVMNDTAARSHHGCARVMRLLCSGLEAEGLTITARALAHADWAKDASFVAALDDADVVVINGEGTLHHGRPAAETLLRIVDHPSLGTTPIVLCNALYEANPPEWGARYLTRFALLAARDSESATRMHKDSGAPARWLPDLSLSAPANVAAGPRQGVIVGDSVKLRIRRVWAASRATSAARAFCRPRHLPPGFSTGPLYHI
jgi:polysaccharide pyruvyl transferase WcaK-like protein